MLNILFILVKLCLLFFSNFGILNLFFLLIFKWLFFGSEINRVFSLEFIDFILISFSCDLFLFIVLKIQGSFLVSL